MGRATDINKIKEENGIHYYAVADFQPNKTKFIIAINAQKKTVSYFLTSDCKDPIAVIDFNKTSGITPVPPFDTGTAESAFLLAGAMAYRAVRDNNFPDFMGKYS